MTKYFTAIVYSLRGIIEYIESMSIEHPFSEIEPVMLR